MAANPDPARITAEFWYLWEQMHALEPKSKLGGIYTKKPGYHASRKDNQINWPGNYSITDTEDKGGPSDKAAAIDWTFPDAQAGRYDTIMKYSARLLASGKDPDDPRMDGWREFYGQADKDTAVEGWDFRYVRAATSDPSHLWHIHLSCDRDKVTSKANMDALLSVLRGEPVATLDKDDVATILKTDGIIDSNPKAGDPATDDGFIRWETAIERDRVKLHRVDQTVAGLATKMDEILAALAAAGLTGATLKFEGTATTIPQP